MSIYATVSAIQPITAIATLVNSVVGGDSYTGFQDYNDTSTEVTPLSLAPGVWVDVPNNGAGHVACHGIRSPHLQWLADAHCLQSMPAA